jgi:hypothetical protein
MKKRWGSGKVVVPYLFVTYVTDGGTPQSQIKANHHPKLTMALQLLEKVKRQSLEILIDRELQKNKGELGIILYDEVVKSFEYEGVVAADEDLLEAVQAEYIEIHREVAALLRKREMLKKNEQERAEKGNQVEDRESPKKERIPEVLWNKAKYKAELFVIDQKIREMKRQFGVRAYKKLASLEEEKNWKPSELKLQTSYIKCRQNVRKLEAARQRAKSEVNLVDEVAAAVVTLSEEAPVEEAQNEIESVSSDSPEKATGPSASGDSNSRSVSQPAVDVTQTPTSTTGTCFDDSDMIEEKKIDSTAHVEDFSIENQEERQISEQSVAVGDSEDADSNETPPFKEIVDETKCQDSCERNGEERQASKQDVTVSDDEDTESNETLPSKVVDESDVGPQESSASTDDVESENA